MKTGTESKLTARWMTTARESRRCEQFVNIFSLRFAHRHAYMDTHTLLRQTVCMCFFRLGLWSSLLRTPSRYGRNRRIHLKRSECCLFLLWFLAVCRGHCPCLPWLAHITVPHPQSLPFSAAARSQLHLQLLHTYSFHGLTRTFIIFLSRRRAYVTKRQPPSPPTPHIAPMRANVDFYISRWKKEKLKFHPKC